MGLNFKKWFKDEENDVFGVDGVEDSYYALKPEEALKDNNGGSKMILLEPRAYSESQQIVDHLKNRNIVISGQEYLENVKVFVEGREEDILKLQNEKLSERVELKDFVVLKKKYIEIE